MRRRVPAGLLAIGLVVSACSGKPLSSGDAGSGDGTGAAGMVAAAGTNGAAGAPAAAGAVGTSDAGLSPEYGIVMTTATTDETSTYRAAMAVRGLDSIAISGMATDAAGKTSYVRIQVRDAREAKTYPCSGDSVRVSTQLFCCPYEYDSKNPEPINCSVTFTDPGTGASGEAIGTFSGTIMDTNGGRMTIKSGSFRVKVSYLLI